MHRLYDPVGSDLQPEQAVLDGIKDVRTFDLSLEEKVERIIARTPACGEKDNVSCVCANLS